MAKPYVLRQLLDSNPEYSKNFDLLKKIILTTQLGYFRVNNLAPDNAISLGDYLFDEERIMFDYTRLNLEHRKRFQSWLRDDHVEDQRKAPLRHAYTNEDRGYTAEASFNWWGKFIHRFTRSTAAYWKLSNFRLAFHHQLLGIQINQGKQGSLIEFNQFAPPSSGTKYKAENDLQPGTLGNTKRVFLTNELVDQLLEMNLDEQDFASIYENPHPLSIEVTDQDARHRAMRVFRRSEHYIDSKPWFQRLWDWVLSFFTKKKPPEPSVFAEKKLQVLHETKTTKLLQTEDCSQLLVQEKTPDTENLVFCGGGAKIFAHVGVWKALCEANIKPNNFIGSSAGAIMALFCYLGYTADEIDELFKQFRREHIIYYNIDRQGFSNADSLKTALDYFISLKIIQIVEKYQIPFPEGELTFAALEKLRVQCPGCGIGKQLVVTGTNLKTNQVHYFSLEQTPDLEVSEVVKVSASMPIVFKPTKLNGDLFVDGGMKSNFPTEVCVDDNSTFLEYINLLAVQFDNGSARETIDSVRKLTVDGWLFNWIYSKLSGINEPIIGWHDDRLKLRKHGIQTIVPKTDISSTSFGISDELRQTLVNNGYRAAKDYLDVRGEKEDEVYKNQEYLFNTFDSWGDLLIYCVFRRNLPWFKMVTQFIEASSLPNKEALMEQSLKLNALYFKEPVHSTEEQTQIPAGSNAVEQTELLAELNEQAKPDVEQTQVLADRNKEEQTQNTTDYTPHSEPLQRPMTFFGHTNDPKVVLEKNHKLLLLMHPIFLKITSEWVHHKDDKRHLEMGRHALALKDPFKCLEHFNKILSNKGPNKSHLFLPILIHLITELQKDHKNESVLTGLSKLHDLLKDPKLIENLLTVPEYYGSWKLNFSQCLDLIDLLQNPETEVATILALTKVQEAIQKPECTFFSTTAAPQNAEIVDERVKANSKVS